MRVSENIKSIHYQQHNFETGRLKQQYSRFSQGERKTGLPDLYWGTIPCLTHLDAARNYLVGVAFLVELAHDCEQVGIALGLYNPHCPHQQIGLQPTLGLSHGSH